MRRALALGAVVLAACCLTATARADGDPASDYLLVQQVFLPFDGNFPKDGQKRLTALVAAANRAGYKIRVALIWSSYDLGAVTSLWKQPRTYARFLGAELSFVYKQRLLIVMPAGFGFHWKGHPSAPAYAALKGIPVEQTPSGMLADTETAVRRLAAASGVTLSAKASPASSSGSSTNHDRILIAAAAVAVLAFLVIVRMALPRRRPR
jgi:hypothetical protein